MQEGRYAALLDYPSNASEFQRADCAPRSTLGDGAITVADWVQVGRYVAGLDPLTRAGGPTNSAGPNVVSAAGAKAPAHGLDPRSKGTGPREIKVTNAYLAPGLSGAVSVLLEAQGDENALGFSVSFDPTAFTYTGATLGANAAGASMDVNATQAASGKLAVILALPTGATFAAGADEVVRVNLTPVTSALGAYTLALTDQPVTRMVVDPAANTLAASYVSGSILVNPLPTLTIAPAQQNVTLSWPLWATNYTLQEAEGSGVSSLNWSNVPVALTVTNNQATVSVPVSGNTKFYRLQK